MAAAKSKKTSSKKAPKASKSSVSKSKSTKDPATMEELLTQTGHKIRAFTRGEKVEARLLEIGKIVKLGSGPGPNSFLEKLNLTFNHFAFCDIIETSFNKNGERIFNYIPKERRLRKQHRAT